MTEPTVEPLTLGEVRNRLRLSQGDDDQELRLIWIPAARREIERAIGQALCTQTLKLTLDTFPLAVDAIELPVGPVQSITTLKYYDEDNTLQTWSSVNYVLEKTMAPARITLADGVNWPVEFDRTGAVEVNFVAGYGAAADVPATLRAAMLLQVCEMYEGRITDQLSPTVERLLSLEWDGQRHGPTC